MLYAQLRLGRSQQHLRTYCYWRILGVRPTARHMQIQLDPHEYHKKNICDLL
jgi:hypothetical protein